MRDEISYRRFRSMWNGTRLITGHVSQLTAASRRPCLLRPAKGRDVNQSSGRPHIKLPRGASVQRMGWSECQFPTKIACRGNYARSPAPINKRPIFPELISYAHAECNPFISRLLRLRGTIPPSIGRASPGTYVAGRGRSIVKLAPAAGDTYKLANQVLIPLRFTPISPHPAANTLIRPLILQDKSFRSSYDPFVVATVSRIGSRGSDRMANGSDSSQSLLLVK